MAMTYARKGTMRKEIIIQKTVRDNLLIGTWNVRGTYYEGALKDLEEQVSKYKIEILAVQETKQKDTFTMELENYIFFNSGEKSRIFGSGFLVTKKLKHLITKFTPINEKMCHLQIRGQHRNINFLNIHAPTEDKEEEEKNAFYEMIENFYDTLPEKDVNIMLGDFNAKVGKEEVFEPTIGKFSKHEYSNENGLKLIGLAAGRNCKIMSTFFQHKNIHLGTWESPDGRTINQIDHVIIQDQFKGIIKDVRAYRGAEMDSDHRLVRIKIDFDILKPNKIVKRTQKKYNVKALEQEKMRMSYQKKLRENLKKVQGNSNQERTIEEHWKSIETILKIVGEDTLGTRRKQKRESWFNNECKEARSRRQKAREKMLKANQQEDIELYREQKRRTKATYRKTKRAYLENKLRNIEDHYKRKEIKNFYQEIKNTRQGQHRTLFCKDKNGKLCGDDVEGIEIWKEYFQGILNRKDTREEEIEEVDIYIEQDSIDIPEPTKDEIIEIIAHMKNNKSPGENGIQAELIKYGGEQLVNEIYELIKKIWRQEQIPEVWKEAIIMPLHKKGNKTVIANYRGIALLDTMYKILAIAIRNRLTTYAESIIGEYQCGFRKNRSVTDQIFTLKEIQTTCYEHNIELHAIFIDFQRAYDSINRNKLYWVMREMKIPSKIIRLVRMTIEDSVSKVKVNGIISEPFQVTCGLRQGDPLSTTLFNIILENVIRESEINRTGTIINRSHQCLAYADDITILARTKKELKIITRQLESKARLVGLEINAAKTKYMQLNTTDPQTQIEIDLEGDRKLTIEKISNFTYLGVWLSQDGNTIPEIKARIVKGDRCAGSLSQFLRSKSISRKAKIQMYKTILRPTVTYGCETWVMNKADAETLEIWERKMLRKIFGGKRNGEVWERRTNDELTRIYGEPTITQFVRAQRLRWLGHIERREDSRTVKSVLNLKPVETRRQGRPRTRWLETVQKDLKEKGVGNWKTKAKDRNEWRKITQLWA